MSRPKRQPPKYADAREVLAASDQWTDEQIECRELGHHWRATDAVHVARLRYYRIRHTCERCGIVRTRELSDTGHVYAQTYDYPEGYLIVGLGRIAGDGKDAVRLAAIRRIAVTEVRGRAKESDMPRFGATRRAIG